MTTQLTPGDRRELRSIVKGRFKVLRAEVKRRETEMKAEIEAELVDRYRVQQQAIADARREVQEIIGEALRSARLVAARLSDAHPDVEAEIGTHYGGIAFDARIKNRAELHRALIAAIPDKIGDAQLELDRQENDLLQSLSVGALQTEQAQQFMATIPTVGELVPRARLREIEGRLGGKS